MKLPFAAALAALLVFGSGSSLAVFTDDFSSFDTDVWSSAEGNWALRAEQLAAEGKFCRLDLKDFSAMDVEVSAEVTSMHDASHAAAGVIARLGEDGMGYAACVRQIERGVHPEHGPWERPVLQLFRIESDGWKLLQESKVMDSRDGLLRKIKLQCKGPDIFVYHGDMETPVIREFDEAVLRPGGVALFKDQTGSALFDNVAIGIPEKTPEPSLRKDWSWVRGAVYVSSGAVNSVDMWHNYQKHRPTIERELFYAKTYGFNMIQLYLHWIVWERHGEEYLNRIEDFLTLADGYGLKVNLIFWDDCGHVEPSLETGTPVPGRHNSRMMPNPSHRIRDSSKLLEEHREAFRGYVEGIARRFKDDPRISFWQLYNEAMGARETYRVSETDANIDTLLRWTREWVKGTGTKIPVTATWGGFQGAKYSDFPTYHSYAAPGQDLPNTDGGPEHLCTETLNRPHADIAKIFDDIVAKNQGFIVWELMIGRDNCRFPWGHPDGLDEPAEPFHGVIYPDGHPWKVSEVERILGPKRFAALPVFDVRYFTGRFAKEVKRSITPCIEFDLGDEPGTGSPDASAGIPKDDFSIRWSGNFTATRNGTYTFSLQGDGEHHLKVGGKELSMDASGTATIDLKKGEVYAVEVSYYHLTGDSRLALRYGEPGRPLRRFTPDPRGG